MTKNFGSILAHFIEGKIGGTRILSGSNRKFFRIFEHSNFVVMLDQNRDEAARYVNLLKKLYSLNIPVPQVFAFDDSSGALLLEDIGKISLFDWYRSTGDFEPHLRAAEILARIHYLNKDEISPISDFDYWDFLYETQYFTRHFLIGYCGFTENIENILEDEFVLLANLASRSPKGFMHRDYQSQNIFVANTGVKIVDFQGARFGFRAYDLASLIEDPYLNLPYSTKVALINEYLEKSDLSPQEKLELLEYYPYNAIQRLLQATTAFAYLSKIAGKDWFEKFIISALERAKNLLRLNIDKFPTLLKILNEAKMRVSKYAITYY